MLMMLAPFARVSAGKLQERPADAHDARPVCEGFSRKAQLMLMMVAPFACCRNAQLMLMMLAPFARVSAGKPS